MSYGEIWLYIAAVYLGIAIGLTIVVMMVLPRGPHEVSGGVRLFRTATLCILWFPFGIAFLIIKGLGIEQEAIDYIHKGFE